MRSASAAEDVDVVAGLAGRGDGWTGSLHSPFARGDGAVGFGPGHRGGEDHVGQLRSARHEDVLHDEAVEAGEQLAGVVDVGFGVGRVLADHERGGELAGAPLLRTST